MKRTILLLAILAVLLIAALIPLFIGLFHRNEARGAGNGESAAILSGVATSPEDAGAPPDEDALSSPVLKEELQHGQPQVQRPAPESGVTSSQSSSSVSRPASSYAISPSSSLSSSPPSSSASGPASSASYAEQVAELVNKERTKAGLQPLAVSQTVTLAAQERAKEIEEVFSHTRPDGSSFSTALAEQNIVYRSTGENIAWGQRTPEQVMQGWMNSPGHRANILNPNFTAIGIGYHRNPSGTSYWTQLFIG